MTPTPPLPKLPEWIECDEAVRNGSATALQAFIESQEPAGIAEQEEFRTKLQLALSEALSQRGEAVAWLHKCRKRPDLKQLSFLKRRPDLAAKGYKPQPLFTAPQPAQPDVLSLLLSDEVLEAATLAHEQSSCHDLIGPMSDALKAAAERVRAMVPAQPAKPVPMKEAEARAEFNRQLDGFNKRGYAENMPNDFCDFLLGIRFAESFHHIKEQP